MYNQLFILALLFVSVHGDNGVPKVTLCHCPPGNLNNCHTITVGAPAALAHFKNHARDYLGECTSKPTPKPTPCDTERPTGRPTPRPTARPTKKPTSRPTGHPTQRPTQRPTQSPTLRPTTFCPNSVLQFAVDRSRSIDKKELGKQFAVINQLLDIVDIDVNALSISLASFAKGYYHNNGIYTSTSSAKTGMQAFMDRSWKRVFYTEYIPIFTHAKNLPNNAVVVIASDGRPFTKKYRGSKKSTKISCDARNKLKKARPDIKILCFQSTKYNKATPFYKCGCDGVWLSYQKDYDKEFVAEQMKNFICSHRTDKEDDPCVGIKDKKKCNGVMRTNSGHTPVSIMDVVTSHCIWNKKRKCSIRRNFIPLYNRGDI